MMLPVHKLAWFFFFFFKNENVRVGGSVLFSCLFVKINHPADKWCDLGFEAKCLVYFQKFFMFIIARSVESRHSIFIQYEELYH